MNAIKSIDPSDRHELEIRLSLRAKAKKAPFGRAPEQDFMTRRSSSSEPSQRQLRVGELIRHELASLLARGAVQDPALDGKVVTVCEVRVSPDLRHATVYVEPLGGEGVEEVIEGLTRARKFLRGALGKAMTTKFTPELRFVEDRSFAEAAHMDALLRSGAVARDLTEPDGEKSDEEEE